MQNVDAFRFVDQLLGSSLHFETAGSLHGGRRVWVLATLPDHIRVGGDDVRPYLLLMNSHDGSTSILAATTPVRTVCQNTLNPNVRIERVIRSCVLSESRLDEPGTDRRFAAVES
ncbi:MAG: DUF932 domain-containing protein [Solirubrobacteraceae bacterium]